MNNHAGFLISNIVPCIFKLNLTSTNPLSFYRLREFIPKYASRPSITIPYTRRTLFATSFCNNMWPSLRPAKRKMANPLPDQQQISKFYFSFVVLSRLQNVTSCVPQSSDRRRSGRGTMQRLSETGFDVGRMQRSQLPSKVRFFS